MLRKTALMALVATFAFALGACEKQGPAERAGEKIDHAVDTVKNGGEEPAGDKLEDAAHDARDAAQQAAEDIKDKN
jgi:hypothetical protein